MEKISAKSADLNLRASDNVKSAGTNRASEVTDDFKKLLQGQQDNSQEVSKDTKTEKKQETEKETAKDTVKDSKKETAKEERAANE